MPEGEKPSTDDALWERLAGIPDAVEHEAEAPHDGRRFRIAPPNRPTTGNEAGAPTQQPRQPAVPPTHDPARYNPTYYDPASPDQLDPAQPFPGQIPDGPEPHPAGPVRRRDRRGRAGKVFALILVLAIFAGVGTFVWAWVLWNDVEQVDTDGALSPEIGGFTNYLIVGTDSREGVSADLATARRIGLGVEGERSDTMVVLHIDHGDNHMVSLPRDLWVTVDQSGANKLNAARSIGGVPALIRTIQADPGIPIHHYLEVDIAGFLNVVDAVGSITITFDAPACDPKSGLNVRRTGRVKLGPEQALAYVRSRTYTEFDRASAKGLNCAQIRAAGLGTTRGNSDIGRTERQRAFLLAVFDKVGSTRNPITLLRVLSGLTDGLRVDDTMGMLDAIDLMRDLRGLAPTTHALPVADFTAPNGSAALALTTGAPEIIALFGAD